MRAFVLWLLLVLPACAAVVPDGKTVPRDDGAPVLPMTAPEGGIHSATSVSGAGRKPPGSHPGAAGQTGSGANAGQPGSAAGSDAGAHSSSGASAPADAGAFSDTEPLEPVAPAAQQPVPWYLIVLALGLLVATVVIGLMIRQDRGEPS